jgi:hypothetical protein
MLPTRLGLVGTRVVLHAIACVESGNIYAPLKLRNRHCAARLWIGSYALSKAEECYGGEGKSLAYRAQEVGHKYIPTQL